MKTIKIVTDKIISIHDIDYFLISDQKERIKQRKADKKELEFLYEIKRLLLSDVREEYLKVEERRLETLIESLMDRFVPPENLNLKQIGELRKAHEKQYDIPKHRNHLKIIRYILY